MASLNAGTIERALREMGRRLGAGERVEILIVGGAAAVLTGQLPAEWTTSDVDVLQFVPPKHIDEILDVAGEVGRDLSLPPIWMNSDVGLWRDSLPDEWQGRRVRIGTFGRLHVWAISRMDLIAMKFMAHRPDDREHLELMRVTREELGFVLQYLKSMSNRHDKARIEIARRYVEDWKVEQ